MGSTIGWLLAGGLLIVVVFVVVFVVLFPAPSGPTALTTQPGYMQIKTVGVPAAEILGAEPAGEGNAGDDYHQAVETYLAHAEEIHKLIEDEGLPGLELAETLEAMSAQVAAGAAKRSMQYTLVHAPRQIQVRLVYGLGPSQQDPADRLVMVVEGLTRLAALHAAKKDQENFQAAEKILKDCFTLGEHMVDERARPYMVLQGMVVQEVALVGLGRLYSDPFWADRKTDRVEAVERYLDALRPTMESYDAKCRGLWVTKPAPGDVFNVIEHDEDRSFRVQALLLLGVVKHATTHRGDIRYAKKLIRTRAASGDPLERAAAAAARDLTIEQYRNLGRL